MDIRYPIGNFNVDGQITNEVLEGWIKDIENLPSALREAVSGLREEELEKTYRPGGWTIRQVVHHIADSHMNAFIRYKLALTEENPMIKTYDEEKWAEIYDYSLPIEIPLTLLESLHKKWIMVIRSGNGDQLHRTFVHPENGEIPLSRVIGLYAWHGKHHTAHITAWRERESE